jgi:hypothetical protein
MIHDGEGFIESFGGNNVLVIDAFVLITGASTVAVKPDVMFSRNFSELLIIRHT